MSRTIGKHIPPGSPHHDFVSVCGICGVHWPRSKLRMDGAGRLVCPDEGDGLDEVTLAKQNAEVLKRLHRPYKRLQGRAAPPDTDFYSSPTTILGQYGTSGWWAWDQGFKGTPNQANWQNQVIARGLRVEGELVGLGDDVPTLGATGIVFAGGTELRSNKGSFIEAGQAQVDLWAVVSLDEEVETFQEILSIRAVAGDDTAIAGVALGRWRSDTNSGQVWGFAKFAAADAGMYFAAPRPSAGQHLYHVTVTPELCTLQIDDDSYTAVPAFSGGFQVPCGHLRMGYQGYGTYSEAAVST